MIATNIPLSHAINEMPIVLDPARLDDGGGIEETLRRNKAQYHQSCRLMFNNTKLERARKRRAECVQSVECQTKLRRASLEGQTCFISNKEAPSFELRQVMTMNLNNRLYECAQNLNDGKLLARLSGGDAIAQELKYHFACLTDLYNRERTYFRATKRMEQERPSEEDAHPQAFSEIVTYLVETTRSGEGPADIVHMYAQRLEQLGVDAPIVKFVVMMYDIFSTAEVVYDARLDMFVRKQRPYETASEALTCLDSQGHGKPAHCYSRDAKSFHTKIISFHSKKKKT